MSEGQSQSNPYGLAGFIVSLLGLLGCGGLLCPVGLVLSIIGLKREPKGLAIAGVVIGAVGSLGFIATIITVALVGVGGVVAFFFAAGHFEAAFDMAIIEAEIDQYIQDNGAPPANLDALSMETDMTTDAWGNAYVYTVDDAGNWTLSSMGEDGIPDTDDDINYDDF
ncbi:MAG: type II secretion system protein GspG [Planctomycetota bacterium]